jgi:hypothetical protein
MRAVPVFWGVATVVIALFLLQIAKRLTASRSNPVAQTVADGLTFLLNG